MKSLFFSFRVSSTFWTLILFSSCVFAQDSYYESAWIHLSDSTIRQGEIRRLRESDLSQRVLFRSQLAQEPEVFSTFI